jgi:membrane associated rhomboid family serine protease
LSTAYLSLPAGTKFILALNVFLCIIGTSFPSLPLFGSKVHHRFCKAIASQLSLTITPQEAIPTFALDPPEVLLALHHGRTAQLYRALTFPWFHAVLPHLAANMLVFVDTGTRLERAIGTARFLVVVASILLGQAALLLAAFAAFPRRI